MQAPLPLYIGALDMFIVGLGRLSYGDAPDWIDARAKEALERCSGMCPSSCVPLKFHNGSRARTRSRRVSLPRARDGCYLGYV
jgi:hypothetical protein